MNALGHENTRSLQIFGDAFGDVFDSDAEVHIGLEL